MANIAGNLRGAFPRIREIYKVYSHNQHCERSKSGYKPPHSPSYHCVTCSRVIAWEPDVLNYHAHGGILFSQVHGCIGTTKYHLALEERTEKEGGGLAEAIVCKCHNNIGYRLARVPDRYEGLPVGVTVVNRGALLVSDGANIYSLPNVNDE